MKTTVELPDGLMRALKVRAAEEGRRLKDVMADAVRRGLAEPAPAATARARVQLPIVHCHKAASPEEEMTPERTAEVLLHTEAS